MASSSSSSSALNLPVTEKLTKSNFLLWKAQVLPAVRAAQLGGYLDGSTKAPAKEIDAKVGDNTVKVVNPAYAQWEAQNQHLASYLVTSLSRDLLVLVVNCTTAHEIWKEIENVFFSMTRARSVNTRIALATTQKGNLTVSEYVGKMKSLADEMASASSPLEDEELVSYILAGLDIEYNSVVSAMVARVEPFSVGELYAQLLSFDSRMNLLQGDTQSSSVNSASRGNRGGNNRGRGGRGRGNGLGRGNGNNFGGRGNFNKGGSNNNKQQRPTCQLCHKTGHTVIDCWYRFDEDFVPDQKTVAAASNGGGGEGTWYTDTGATDHITSELDKLAVRDKYTGNDQIHAANGTRGKFFCKADVREASTRFHPLQLSLGIKEPLLLPSSLQLHDGMIV
ncbi:hypothetical protein ACP70R_029224 [Stipagrostis hirtigluma subsp. patula]